VFDFNTEVTMELNNYDVTEEVKKILKYKYLIF
jgi:hypothetical protein